MKKVMILIFTALIFVACTKNDIDGIDGLKWSQIMDVKKDSLLYSYKHTFKFKDSLSQDVEFEDKVNWYKSKKMFFNLRGITSDSVCYSLFNEKLWAIEVIINKEDNSKLKEFFIEKYGEPKTHEKNCYLECEQWQQNDITITLYKNAITFEKTTQEIKNIGCKKQKEKTIRDKQINSIKFRKIEWNANLSNMSEMEKKPKINYSNIGYTYEPTTKNIDFEINNEHIFVEIPTNIYQNKNEKLNIGNVQLESIVYETFNNLLFEINCYYEYGYRDLKEILVSQYGQPTKIDSTDWEKFALEYSAELNLSVHETLMMKYREPESIVWETNMLKISLDYNSLTYLYKSQDINKYWQNSNKKEKEVKNNAKNDL